MGEEGYERVALEEHEEQRGQREQKTSGLHTALQGEDAFFVCCAVIVADGGLKGVAHAEEYGFDDAVDVHDDAEGSDCQIAGEVHQGGVEEHHADGAGNIGEEFGAAVGDDIADGPKRQAAFDEVQRHLAAEEGPKP